MKELLKIHRNNEQNVVSARELHEFLEVKNHFTQWFDDNKSLFEEGADYQAIKVKVKAGPGYSTKVDYALTLDTAKEMAMLSRVAKGKEARKYFIEVEKRAREQEANMSPAEQLLHNAQILVEQERRLSEHDNRLKELEAKNTTRPEYFTIAGYGSLIGVPVNIKLASSLGKKAAKICRDNNLMMDECPDPRFGRVKMYPKKVLDQVFETSLI